MATLLEDEYVASGGKKITLTYHGQEGADVGWEAQITGGPGPTLTGRALSLERAIFSALRPGDDEAQPK